MALTSWELATTASFTGNLVEFVLAPSMTTQASGASADPVVPPTDGALRKKARRTGKSSLQPDLALRSRSLVRNAIRWS